MSKSKLPNIILIVCDTLGAKHMSLYGYHRKTTPMMERLVEEEGFTVYKNCYSTSCWTPPAHASLFTGLYPSEHGTNEVNLFLSDTLFTMPDVLTMLGYETIGISCNGMVSEQFSFTKGFQRFFELDKYYVFKINKGILAAVSFQKNRSKKLLELLKLSFKKNNYTVSFKYVANSIYSKIVEKYRINSSLKNATPFTKKALKLAQDFIINCQKPLFLFVNLMQTHNDYNPPPETRYTWSFPNSKKYKRLSHESIYHYSKRTLLADEINYLCDLYDEEILFLDKILCEFYKNIKSAIDIDNTLIIITSDHGENFGEEGHFGHILSLTDAGCKIPLMIKYHGRSTFSFSDRLCQINDLFATIQDIIDSPLPSPESSFSLLSSVKRKKALMEIVHPEIWLTKVKNKEQFNFCFKKEIFNDKEKKDALALG